VTVDATGSGAASSSRRAAVYVWAAPAFVALVAALIAIGHQVLWQDELATFTASTRSIHDLALLAKETDAVLAPYYAFLHVWTGAFGASPVSLRLPSALAIAGAAGVTGLIGTRLFNAETGLLSGLLLAIVPTISDVGQEARPTALALLGAAVSTLILLGVLERPRSSTWALYALSLIALGAVQLTALSIVAAHAVVVAVSAPGDPRRRLVAWFGPCILAALALAPMLNLARHQTGQVGGVPATTVGAIAELPADLFGAAAVALVVIALAVVGALQLRDRRAAICLALAAMPVAVIVLVSFALPMLRVRYLVPSLIGWALLAGFALSRYGKAVAVAATATIVLVGLPQQLDLRGITVNDHQPDYSAIATIIEHQGRDDDAIVMPTAGGIRFRVGLEAYLPGDAWPHDVLATRSPAAAAALDSWECVPPSCIGSPPRIWVGCDGRCSNPVATLEPETAAALHDAGYAAAHVWRVQGGAISLFQ
jgi:mannosyltransferase